MEWSKEISNQEVAIIITFVILYIAFITRSIVRAKGLNTSFPRLLIKLILRSTYLALFIIALLGPTYGNFKKEVSAVAKDIMIAVDLSTSMNATDIQPSRLEKVKYEIKNLIDAFSSDRIGIIVFSSDALVQCHLTYDRAALNIFTETLQTKLVSSAGTDFYPPLETALEKLLNENDPITAKSEKIILLISDGENFGEDTDDLTSEIKEQNIKLFTLGVGSEEGSKIPDRKGYKKDRSGQDVVTKLNSKDLMALADAADGEYFQITPDINESKKLISKINSIKGTVVDRREVEIGANKYYYFLALGLLLALIDMTISIRIIKL